MFKKGERDDDERREKRKEKKRKCIQTQYNFLKIYLFFFSNLLEFMLAL